MKKISGAALAVWLMLGAAVPGSAKDYPVGTVFTDLFRISYPAAQKTVPLPPGEWKLVSRFEYRTGTSNIPIVRFYLLRHTEEFVTGAIRITTHKELVNFQWGASNLCGAKRKKVAWHSKSETYDGYENCNIAYPLRGFSRRSKSLKKVFGYIDERNLKGPNIWVSVVFARAVKDEMMQAYYALPPEHYGFPRQRKFSNTESPWSINNIHDHPKKKAFMDKTVAWMQSWRKLVDQGFDNNLRKKTVQAHPRIDGMAPPPAPKSRAPRMAAEPAVPPVERKQKIAKLAPPPVPLAPEGPLKPAHIKKLIDGQTAFGVGGLIDSRVSFDARGQLDGRLTRGNTDYEDSGRWSIDSSGRLCLDWANEEFTDDACFRTVKKGTKILMQDNGGDTIFVLTL